MEVRAHSDASKSTRFPTRFSCLGPFSHLSSLFISRFDRLWTRYRPIYSLRSTGQSLPLIYWTRLRVESQRPKVPRTGLILNAQLAPKSSSLLNVEPEKAPPSLELLKNPVKKTNFVISSGHPAASTEEGHCIANPVWILFPTSNPTRGTISKTTKQSIGQYDPDRCPYFITSSSD